MRGQSHPSTGGRAAQLSSECLSRHLPLQMCTIPPGCASIHHRTAFPSQNLLLPHHSSMEEDGATNVQRPFQSLRRDGSCQLDFCEPGCSRQVSVGIGSPFTSHQRQQPVHAPGHCPPVSGILCSASTETSPTTPRCLLAPVSWQRLWQRQLSEDTSALRRLAAVSFAAASARTFWGTLARAGLKVRHRNRRREQTERFWEDLRAREESSGWDVWHLPARAAALLLPGCPGKGAAARGEGVLNCAQWAL